jgi:hypothetical protein
MEVSVAANNASNVLKHFSAARVAPYRSSTFNEGITPLEEVAEIRHDCRADVSDSS